MLDQLELAGDVCVEAHEIDATRFLDPTSFVPTIVRHMWLVLLPRRMIRCIFDRAVPVGTSAKRVTRIGAADVGANRTRQSISILVMIEEIVAGRFWPAFFVGERRIDQWLAAAPPADDTRGHPFASSRTGVTEGRLAARQKCIERANVLFEVAEHQIGAVAL